MWGEFEEDDEIDDSDLLDIDLNIYQDKTSAETNCQGNEADQGESSSPTSGHQITSIDPTNAQFHDNDTERNSSSMHSATTISDDPERTTDSSLFRSNEHRRLRREAGEPPIDVFRRGYLWVSDFSRQVWCEQQVEYSYTLDVVLEESPEITAALSAGTNFHLARELDVPDLKTVAVSVTSREDSWAVKVLNLLEAIDSLSKGAPVRREVPIFGCAGEDGTFLVGLIDEIRVDTETFSFEISELKTRTSKTLPSRAQKLSHDIQVMLYKKLFDDLVRGRVDKESMAKALGLRLEHELGDDLKQKTSTLPKSPRNLNDLLTYLFERMQGLPFIAQCLVEYCYQEDNTTIAIQTVHYDEAWLAGRMGHLLGYWTSGRPVQGVDIEDAWKCQRCDFAEVCEWRKRKSDECRNRNLLMQSEKK